MRERPRITGKLGCRRSSGGLRDGRTRHRGFHEPQGELLDNAVTETLFGALKVERLHGERFETIRQAKDAVLAWLLWYNWQRMHSTLNYLSPVEFENAHSLAAA